MSDLNVGRIEQLTHTSGPWRVRLHSGTSANGATIESLTDTVTVAVLPRRADRPYGQKEADAHLIAAAPELLKALRDLLQVITADDLVPESVSYMQQARAAIQKAEGRTS